MSARRPSLPAVALAGLLLGCETPRSSFETARVKLDSGDLIAALVELDRVAPREPEYAEARSLAAAVERRIRTGQRLFARGLALRAQWRDEDALKCFELAREVWPADGATASLIEATRHRIAILDAAGAGEVETGAVVQTTPVLLEAVAEDPLAGGLGGVDRGDLDEPEAAESAAEMDELASLALPAPLGEGAFAEPVGPEPSPAEGGAGSAAAAGPGEPPVPELPAGGPVAEILEAGGPDEGGGPEPGSPGVGATDDDVRIRAGLGKAVTALQGGRLDEALAILGDLYRSRPEAAEVRSMFVRVSHQRALLHYGQGELARAVEVWGRILEIDPDHQQARTFRSAARSELDGSRQR
jgi:tetratricopeptide (TPR) repeat protein